MTSKDEKTAKLSKVFEDFLRAVDRSPGRYPELLDTPVRAAELWLEDLLDGYDQSPEQILLPALPANNRQGMVVIKNIFFHSVCTHHLLPIHGVVHIAYMPGESIAGYSTISELVDVISHRLISQEQIAKEICAALTKHLKVNGAACVVDAEQLCMIIRRVRKPGTRVINSEYTGSFLEDSSLRMEFLRAIDAEEAINE